MADSFQLPPELQARLDAAGVTDQESLLAALRADPDLERDYRAFLEAKRKLELSKQIRQLLFAFAAVPNSAALAQFWTQVPTNLKDALLNTVETLIAQQEQAGGADVVDGLRQRLTDARQLQARQRQAEELIQQALEALGTIPDDQLADMWQQVPLEMEDAFLAAAEEQATALVHTEQSAEAERLSRRVAALRQLREQQRWLRDARPTARAVLAFLQVPTDDDARRLFAEQRVLLQPYEAQRLVDHFAQQAADEHRPRLAKRAALVRTLRGAAPQPEPVDALAAPQPDTLTFQIRDVQVAGNLMQAGGSIYIHSAHVEAGGNAVVINNIRVEHRWTRPRPPQFLRPMISRQADLEVAKARLLQHGTLAIIGTPAMGIQGMAGVGKTTLAQQLAFLLDQDYPDGVIWQSVGPDLKTPEQVQPILNQWARYALILPVDLDAVAQFEASAVRALLGEHPQLLVVLDNVWSLEAIRPLRDALPPEAHLIITTRSRNVLIALGHGYELGLLSVEDARRLVALRLEWGELVPPEQQEWCDTLIQGVGFHALALDVALGVLRRESSIPEEWRMIAERLVDHLRTGRDFANLRIPEAERELHVERVLAFSYERMDPEAHRSFRLLGALAPDADFATAAAGAIWERDETDTRRILNEFLNAALLTNSGSGRWQQHALLRGYALALLHRAGEQEQASARHAIHFTLAMEHAVKANQVSTILPEQPQLRHAFAWVVENDLALAFRLVEGTTELRALFGLAPEQLVWAEQLYAAACQRGTTSDQARALFALGNALHRVAVAPGQDYTLRLVAALSAYEEVLRWYRPDTAPLSYAMTQNNRAIVLSELAALPGEDRRGRFLAALSAYDEALEWYQPDTSPLQYAATENNRGLLLSKLAGLPGEDRRGQLVAALSAYDEALRFQTPDTAPLDYAMTQNNRGLLLRELAGLPGEDRRGRLLAGLLASDEALRFQTPDTAPLNYATAQNSRAVLLSELAGLPGEDRRGRLVAALSAYEEALRFRTPDAAPLDYARTQNNRGLLLSELAGLPGEDRRGRLLAGLATSDEALRFRTPNTAPLEYAMTQNNRGLLLRALADQPEEDRRERLLAALSAYEEALRFRTTDTTPLDYAVTQNNRAVLLREMAGLPGEDWRTWLQEALRIGWEALGWFEHLEHAPYTEIARGTIHDLRVACGDLFTSMWEELSVGLVPDWLQQPISSEEQLQARLVQLGVIDEAGFQVALASDPELQQWMMASMLQSLLSINDVNDLLQFWQEMPSGLEGSFLAYISQAAAEAEQAGNQELAQALRAQLDELQQIQTTSAQPSDEPTNKPEEPPA